ncbi:MAG: DNA gyrase inhibitor YacG [Pseudomonadota bacterium]
MTDPVDLSQSKTNRPKKASTGQCPVCGKPTVQQFRPFCSKRCAHLDLAKWFNEEYTIPVREEDLRDDERPIESHGFDE